MDLTRRNIKGSAVILRRNPSAPLCQGWVAFTYPYGEDTILASGGECYYKLLKFGQFLSHGDCIFKGLSIFIEFGTFKQLVEKTQVFGRIGGTQPLQYCVCRRKVFAGVFLQGLPPCSKIVQSLVRGT